MKGKEKCTYLYKYVLETLLVICIHLGNKYTCVSDFLHASTVGEMKKHQGEVYRQEAYSLVGELRHGHRS